jgi:hypothetical protein
MRWICLVFLITMPLFAQKSDRRRLEGEVFLKKEQIIDALNASRWRFGNVYVSPLIGFKELGYDDNVFSTENNEIDDISISPEVGLQSYARLSPFWVWENRLTYDYLYYVDLDNLRGSEYGADSRLYGLFKKTYLDIGASFDKDRQRLNSEIDERVTSDRIAFDANFILQPVSRGHLALRARVASLEYDSAELENQTQAAGFDSLERDETSYKATWLYKWQARLWPTFEVSQRTYDFDQPNNVRDDSSFTGFMVGARNDQGTRLNYHANIGMEQLDFKDAPRLIQDPANPGDVIVDPTGTVDLDDDVFVAEIYYHYDLSRRYYFESSVLQTPIFSLTESYAYFLSRKISVEVGLTTRRKIRIGPEILIGENDYRKSFDTTLTELRNDEISGFNLNMRFPMKKVLEWRVTAGWLKRDSNLPSLSDEGFRLSATITFNGERERAAASE